MLTGCMFIIPNHLTRIVEATTTTQKDWERRLKWANIEAHHEEDLLVQVWWTSEECDNWRSHNWKSYPELFGNIPDHLPVTLFAGKKEGDKIAFRLGEIQAEVELRQLGFRYEWAGPFEKVLERLLEKA
jgi:hypothetical protein